MIELGAVLGVEAETGAEALDAGMDGAVRVPEAPAAPASLGFVCEGCEACLLVTILAILAVMTGVSSIDPNSWSRNLRSVSCGETLTVGR